MGQALTSRLLLLHAVGKQTSHANKTLLSITSSHGKNDVINLRLTKLAAFFKALQTNAEQLTSTAKWCHILSLVFVKYLKGRILRPPDLITVMT